MKTEYRNVCDVIVKNDVCIGCGLCAGICPVQVLRTDFNAFGEYQPLEYKSGCLPKCNLCLDVCPFWDRNPNEDELGNRLFSQIPQITHRSETGFFLDGMVGYSLSDGHRENGSSGGLITWLTETLLTQKEIDRVICVGSTQDPKRLFKYKVCSSIEECRNASGSVYYPVELSEAIRYILANDGRYLITGLPCYIKGLRLAMARFPKLRKRIVYLVGLVCSQYQSKAYTEQLCQMGGGDPEFLEAVRFRIKDPGRRADDYGFQFKCSSGEVKEGILFFRERVREIWFNGYYVQNACQFCDDLFAETADITFMDAWLPEYKKDPKGHNLLLVRSQALRDLIDQEAANHKINVVPIEVTAIVQSQKNGLQKKRGYLTLRSGKKANSSHFYQPEKRIFPAYVEIEEKLLFILRGRLREVFREKRKTDPAVSPFSREFLLRRAIIYAVLKLSFFPKKFRNLTHPVSKLKK